MISHTFKPFSRIGNNLKKHLHTKDIRTWEALLSYKESIPVGNQQEYKNLLQEVEAFVKAKTKGDLAFLAKRFPQNEKWRILAEYFPKASYLDIETTGLSRKESTITVIVCFHRGDLHTFVQNENMGDFISLMKEIELLVSFNGTSFDLPMIENSFHLPPLKCAHVDLRWVCYHLGFQGGLKKIEKQLDIRRPKDLYGVDGQQAVMLWYEWQHAKNPKAKKKLIRYCQADVLSLILVAGALLEKKKVPLRNPGIEIFNQYLSNQKESL